jgi:hypothetical protein
MGIEHTEGVGTMVTGEHIELFRLMALASALALEVNTGMKMSHGRSPMTVAKEVTGSAKRSKRGVLADLVAHTTAKFPMYRPVATVTKALEGK